MNEVPTLILLDSVCKVISDLSMSIEKRPSSNKILPLSGSLNAGNFLGPRTTSSNRQIRIASTSAITDYNQFKVVDGANQRISNAYLSVRRLLQFCL